MTHLFINTFYHFLNVNARTHNKQMLTKVSEKNKGDQTKKNPQFPVYIQTLKILKRSKPHRKSKACKDKFPMKREQNFEI